MSRRHQKSSRDGSPKRMDCPYDHKSSLKDYLTDCFNIHQQEDFWKFYLKYLSAKRNSNFDNRKLLNFCPSQKSTRLQEKLPLYTHRGDKIEISSQKFDTLISAVLTYQGFQQKLKFEKLKSLRKSQNELPIAQFKAEIIEKVCNNRVILIAGDTGCGKSTQVPQYIAAAGFKKIACTQPRRIACVSLSKRVAHESLASYKNEIGYQIRFEKTKNKTTNIIFLTEGILLRQAGDSDVLASYDALILDEVHERHLNMDFLIGIVKCLLHKQDFKLILMSATINLQLFENYFLNEGVQTIKVPGRLFPIDIIYRPIVKDAYDKRGSRFDCQPYLSILEMIDAKYKPEEKGDVLIFLNGFNEINSLASAVEQYREIRKNWVVQQLHSSLSLEEQDKVFCLADEGIRKCIISTNIAETSVTIDGVRFVIDSGKVNRMMYENCGVNRLFETTISQDSAKQRAGRAGRTGPGICYRLYSEEEFTKFESFTPAEIHLVPLENLILSMITLGLRDIEQFPFLEKPSVESLKNSLQRLSYLEALKKDDNGLSLTPLGDAMSRLPVDLTVSKMLIVSTVFGCVNAALAIASLLSVQNPLVESKYYETKEYRTEYDSNHGEPVTLLNLYKAWLEIKRDGGYSNGSGSSRNKHENSRSWSKKRGIEEQRFYEVTKLIEQFRDILQDAELIPRIEDTKMNSSDRAVRNGELKQLKSIRRELKFASNDFKRRKLDEDNAGGDLRDVEFRITNDFKKLGRLLRETRTDSYKDLMLLKLILTGALYPQVAVEDEFNSSKSVNERLFHTKNKNYVFLRPTSFFNENPDALELDDAKIDEAPAGYSNRRPLSAHHQILAFQKLLETRKTYLMNTFRMPALQTLLLFGKKIATNRMLTRFVFDDFISVECPFLWQGKVLLLTAVDLRKKLKNLLEKKLNDNINTDNEDKFYLVQELTDFMQSNASYNIRRLLPADIKVIYDDTLLEIPKTNPFDTDFTIKNHTIGLQVTENVFYSALNLDDYELHCENVFMNGNFDCANCSETLFGSDFFTMLCHERSCKKSPKTREKAKVVETKPNSKQFECNKCGQKMTLTPVEFLKHKKHCVPIKTEK